MNIRDFVQLMMVSLVQECGNLVTTLSTQSTPPIGIPNLEEVLTAEISENYRRLAVPNRVAADLMGVSLSKLHRIRRTAHVGLNSTMLADIVWALRETGPCKPAELLGQFGHHPVTEVSAVIRYLKQTKIILNHGECYELSEEWLEPTIDRDVIFARLSTEHHDQRSLNQLMPTSESIAPELLETGNDGRLRNTELFRMSIDDSHPSFGLFQTVSLLFSSFVCALVERLTNEPSERRPSLSYFRIPAEQEDAYRDIHKEYVSSVKSLLEENPRGDGDVFIEAFVGFRFDETISESSPG